MDILVLTSNQKRAGALATLTDLARCAFNARVIGRLYAGAVSTRGLRPSYRQRAWRLGRALAWRIRMRDSAGA